ncbi:MAG: MoxR family ATPase [Planctomycetota bacterium]
MTDTPTASTTPTDPIAPDELIAQVKEAADAVKEQVGRLVVGQSDVVEQLIICLFTRGHGLLVGVPGLAKTLLVSTLAKSLSLEFNRIQFTPDLMPSDITGTEVIEEDKATGERRLRFVKGPVFANVILADEINRTPPKTQAALLEAMQEGQVTAGGQDMALPKPFFVLATQNPIEQEGTYPLPEAQLDRFMFNIKVGYPSEREELDIVRRTTRRGTQEVEPVLTGERVLEVQGLIRDVPVADHVIQYALRLVRATRFPEKGALDDRPDFLQKYLSWGAGPRASQNLVLAGKAHAVLRGRTHVTTDDISAVALPVLRHRVLVNFAAEADGVSTDDLIQQLIEYIPADPARDREAEAVLR